ncbi:hypothetical protein DVH05_010490 [Phytophthora capsici]|nr:hypothetical protein DVH05_010490 [Phytophthora capsici]
MTTRRLAGPRNDTRQEPESLSKSLVPSTTAVDSPKRQAERARAAHARAAKALKVMHRRFHSILYIESMESFVILRLCCKGHETRAQRVTQAAHARLFKAAKRRRENKDKTGTKTTDESDEAMRP